MAKRSIQLMACTLIFTFSAAGARPNAYLATAEGAAQWLSASTIAQKTGVVWSSDPRDPKTVNTSLYAGTPGPILFFLEAYRYTGEQRYLKLARSGADALLASMRPQDDPGLYEGLAGTGFTLAQTYFVTKDTKYRDGALRTVEWLTQSAKPTDHGIKWNDTTDVIAGSAGTGLFLLWADEHLHAKGARELAVRAGEHLIDAAQHPAPGQLKWMMDPKFPREMPNFSHGTSGVAYFLATLYGKTGDKRFLDAAVAGAHYLTSIADTQGEACLIYHDDSPEGKKMYYLGWCHGPAGTARFFYRLYEVTKDPQWMDWMKKLARSLAETHYVGKAVTPGEWDNVSVCCGVTAQAQFYLSLYEATKEKKYLDLARQMSDLLLKKATRDDRGVRWVQAEHRVKPDLLVAQTGLMQGASGIGMWLLHFSAFQDGKHLPVMKLPDNPFTY
ncbi:MAG TPA: lanthionine synthetase LanC family protein [Terriglobales bacterium]|nr:lanthionine synthetase LanC family protein [Terriglobales bacterium]